LSTWLSANASTPVRLLGMGVSKLEEGGEPRVGDIDEALDDITDRFGAGMVTRGLALKKTPD
jgi:hypothetical protein